MDKLISGRYRIIESIGSGGMSVVYKARDEKTGRIVALKVLKEEYQDNEDFVRRFRHEASTAAKVSHPNIVKLYSVGNDGDMQYLVMEYIEGRTLKEVIDREGRLRSERAVRYALKILSALDHAHKNGIIHRDIKPQNILVDLNDDIKVTDFGIARLVDGSTGTLTDSNTVLGSVHYVSPEQANGDPVDAKSDLYSLGIVLYQMLTGTLPFDGDTAVAIAMKQLNEPPRSMRANYRDIPRSLDEVVMKAMEKLPEMRYKSAAEMAKDLKRALKIRKGGFVNKSGYLFKNGLNVALVVLSVVTVLAIVIYGFVKVSDILYGVDVPSVVGLSAAEAQEAVKSADMIAETRYVYDLNVDSDIVISQSPEANSRGRRNKTVTLTVSLGVEPVELPNTVGMDSVSALATLSQYGFDTVNVSYACDEDMDMDIVLFQQPEGSAQPGSTVSLTVNSRLITMPTLNGKTRRQALDLLETLYLKAEIVTGYSSDGAGDIVVLQNPAAGTELLRGDTVQIVVSIASPVTYMSTYQMKVPYSTNVRIVVVSPGGNETEVFNEDCEAERMIYLDLESDEPGEHEIKVYYAYDYVYTDTRTFV